MRFRAIALAIITLFSLTRVAIPWTHGAATPPSTYYSVWNMGNPSPDGDLHVMMSNDGHTFFARSTYNQYVPHDSSQCGVPSVLYNSGKLWVMCSVGIDLSWTRRTLEIASSTDGNTFTYVATVDFSDAVSGAHPQVWGLSWFVDSDTSVYILASVVANSTLGIDNFSFVLKHCSDMTFVSCSASVAITGSGFPSSMVDGMIAKVGSTYSLFYTNWNGGVVQSIDVAQSTSLTSGYTVVKTGNWSGWGANYEAPSLINLGGNNWRIYLDAFGGRLDYSETSAGLTSGWGATHTVSSPFVLRHGNAIPNPVGG